MRLQLTSLMAGLFCYGVLTAVASAQTPTFAPNDPLLAPGEPYGGSGSTIPDSTIPNNSLPGDSSSGTLSPIPDNTQPGTSVAPVTPSTTVVPGTVPTYGNPNLGWYPGYWLGLPPGAIPYQTNYQGFGAPSAGGCPTCPNPCGPQPSLDYGRGYDGFFTGWW